LSGGQNELGFWKCLIDSLINQWPRPIFETIILSDKPHDGGDIVVSPIVKGVGRKGYVLHIPATHALAQRLRSSLIKSNSDNFHDMNEEMVDVAA